MTLSTQEKTLKWAVVSNNLSTVGHGDELAWKLKPPNVGLASNPAV